MQHARSLGYALVTAGLAVILTLGALSISLVEFVPEETATATLLALPSPIPQTPTATLIPSVTPLILESPTASATGVPTFVTSAVNACPIPPGWSQIVVQVGDTLTNIAARYNTSAERLQTANCLPVPSLVAGKTLYVPPVPTSTTAICRKGAANWAESYVVKSGDTIYSIAYSYGVSVQAMKTVNCRASDIIYPQEVLWAPNVPTRTPPPTPLPGETATPYPTEPLTETALPFTLTPVPTATAQPDTPTPQPTQTLPPTLTASPTAFP